MDADDARRAELLAPGHPLMDTVLDATIEMHRRALDTGTLLFDPTDPGTDPRLIVALTAEIVDGTGAVVSKRFEFVTLTPTGGAMMTGPAPYLDLQPLPEEARPAADTALAGAWLADGVEQLATSWAITHAQPQTVPLRKVWSSFPRMNGQRQCGHVLHIRPAHRRIGCRGGEAHTPALGMPHTGLTL